ncbi:MAG: conjugal transfer protein TraX [Escherichia coli]
MPVPRTPHIVDNFDWLKTAAIILVAVDHFGYFFIDDADWWSVFGRMAAPVFFFMLGYAQSRTIPFRWIWLGVILTLLDSWNTNWMWVAPNILLSLALIRLARPHVKALLHRYGWVAFVLLVCTLIAVLPLATNVVDYGAEGWMWALFGLCQRMYLDGKSTSKLDGTTQSLDTPTHPITQNIGLMRTLACCVAAVVYVGQEQFGFSFSEIQLIAVVLGVGVMSLGLCLFRRGPSRFQPPEPIAAALHFIGWHTLEIYAIQLAGSELIIKLVPNLAA